MAKYSKGAAKKVAQVMHEQKLGKLKSSSGQKVTNPKQAIAIALSEAREAGEKVPRKAAPKKAATKKSNAKKTAVKKPATTKAASTKAVAKKARQAKSSTKKVSGK